MSPVILTAGLSWTPADGYAEITLVYCFTFIIISPDSDKGPEVGRIQMVGRFGCFFRPLTFAAGLGVVSYSP